MATFEDLRDELRAEEGRAKDCDFRAMAWISREWEAEECRAKVEALKRAVREALESDPDCPISAQRTLIIRYANRNGFDPDVCAEKWIVHNSKRFREAWDAWKRNLYEIEATLPLRNQKRGN